MPPTPRRKDPDDATFLLVAFTLALAAYVVGLGEALLEVARATFVGLFLLIAYLVRIAKDSP